MSEVWGAWGDGDDQVSVIESSREAAIEEYVDNEAGNLERSDIESGVAKMAFLVGRGDPVLAQRYAPSFIDFLDIINDKMVCSAQIDEPLVLVKHNATAKALYEQMVNELHIMQYWTFPTGESVTVELTFDGDDLVGWKEEK